MKNILGKVSALAVASLFAVGSFAGSVGAATVSSYDIDRAAAIQRAELRKYNERNSYYSKYNSIQNDISRNESRISYYEKDVRCQLDGELRVLLQDRERYELLLSNTYGWNVRSSIRNEINRINDKIENVRHRIRRNESKIKDLKRKRERLDRDLATIMQGYVRYYCHNDNCNYNCNENCNNNENY